MGCDESAVCQCYECLEIDRALIAKYGPVDKFHPKPIKEPDPNQDT